MTRASFFRTLSIFILTFFFAGKILATQNNWLNYTDGRTVYKMASEGNVLWIATSGGVLRYDTITHNRTYYNRGNSPLPHDVVQGLAIDAQGNKWFGTNDGLAKFDGLHWTVWTAENSNMPYNGFSIAGLHNYTYPIYDMAFDNNGILWLAAYGLMRFDGTTFSSYTTSNSNIFSNTLSSVAPDASGNIWIGINSGFSKFDGTTFTRYTNINYFITDVIVDPVTSLKWVATNNGIYSYNGTTFTNYNSVNSNLLTDDIRTLEIDSHSVLWIGTNYGIAKLTGTFVSNYVDQTYYLLQHPPITCIHVDGAGQKWFGIYSAFVKFDGDGWNKFNFPQIPANTVNQVTTDHQGNVWIATTGGIGKFNGTTWTVYNTSNSGLPNNNVQCLAFDNAGNMWVGLTYNGLAKFNGTTWTSYTTANSGLVYNYIRSLAVDVSGKVYMGFYYYGYGMEKFDGTTWTDYTPSNSGIGTLYVNALAADTLGNIWICGDGLTKYTGSTWTVWTTTNSSIPNNNIQGIAIDSQNRKWFGGNGGGLVRFDDVNFTIWNTGNSAIFSDDIKSIGVSGNNNVWISSGQNLGVDHFVNNTWTTYNTTNSGLSSNNITNIAVSPNDFKWFSHSGGLEQFDRNIWNNYGNPGSSGMYDNFPSCMAFDNSTGTKWIGTHWVGGVVKYDGTNWTSYTTTNAPLLLSNFIQAVAVSGNETWVGTPSGLAELVNNTWTSYTYANSQLPGNSVIAIGAEPNGTKWVCVQYYGIAKISGSTWTIYNTSNSGLPNNTTGALLIQNNVKWFCTSSGLTKYDDVTWTVYNTSNSGIPWNGQMAIAADPAGDLWMGSIKGLTHFDGTNWTTWDSINSPLPDMWVTAVAVDANNVKWVGTRNGLARFDGTNWTIYKTTNSNLSSDIISDIKIDAAGLVWVAAGNDIVGGCGISVFNENGFPNNCAGLSSIATSTPVNCGQTCNGTASLNVSGTAPFGYSWLPANTTLPSVSNLCAGTYTYVVTDPNGCTLVDSVSIANIAPLTMNVSSSNGTCPCTGIATATYSGGGPGLSWNWTGLPNEHTSSTDSLCAGTYTVTVTDTYGCSATQNFTITSPPMMTASVTTTPAGYCSPSCTGTASVTISGGTPGYTYSWTGFPNETGASIDSLCAGTFTVTATDALGCPIVTSIPIYSPVAMQLSIIITQAPTCMSCTDGTGTTNLTGGTGPYTITWDGINGSFTNTTLTGGTHIVCVTDAAGCSVCDTILVSPLGLQDNTVSPLSGIYQSTSNSLHISGAQGNVKVFLFDATGRQLLNQETGSSDILLPTLSAGVYVFQLEDHNHRIFRNRFVFIP